MLKQIQARIEHDSEFCHELLKSSERWSARAEDVGSLQESLDKLQGDDASAALADFDVENEMHDVEHRLLFRTHPKLGQTNLYPPRRSARTALPTVVNEGNFGDLRALQRVFLQRVTHLGTQTEYLLAKYPESDPNAT